MRPFPLRLRINTFNIDPEAQRRALAAMRAELDAKTPPAVRFRRAMADLKVVADSLSETQMPPP